MNKNYNNKYNKEGAGSGGKLSESYKRLPNEDHRAHRWAGSSVQKNKKSYTRKDKYKKSRYE